MGPVDYIDSQKPSALKLPHNKNVNLQCNKSYSIMKTNFSVDIILINRQ